MYNVNRPSHYDDVIMTMLASQITSLTVVYSIVYSGVNQRKHQSSASLAFVREIHRGPVNFPHKWPVTRKMFPFDDVIMPFWDTATHGEGHVCGQRSRSHLTLKIQRSRSRSRSNPLVTFEARGSIYMFAFPFLEIGPFLRYSKFHIWPWKFKVKVLAKVKPDGHIWCLKFNWYIWFSFGENQTIFGWDIATSIYDLENSRSRSWPRSNPMVTFEAWSSIDMFAFRFVAIGPFLAEI